MQNQESSGLFGRNIFTDAFQQFDENVFFRSLHHKVKNKSYFAKYKGFKTTLIWLSYLFNIASGATACYAVYWLTNRLIGFELVAWCVAIVFLFFLEKIKRKSSTELWQVLFFNRQLAVGWLTLSLLCFGISLASSSFGVKEGVEDMGPGANLIAIDSTAEEYRQQIATLQEDNLRLEQQRTRSGEIYWPAQKEKQINKELIAQLQAKIIELDSKLEGKNELLSEEYRSDLTLSKWTLIWITIAMEIIFELCIAYIWYYYYRSYVERKVVIGLPPDDDLPHPLPAVTQMTQDPQQIQLAIQATNIKLQELQRKYESVSQSSPTDKDNGSLKNSTTGMGNSVLPMGYFTDAQRESLGLPVNPGKKSSVQTCTDLYREDEVGSQRQFAKERNNLADLYTVIHHYQRHGENYSTPYTENQILSRIGQYERDIEEAQKRKLGTDIISNRNNWLAYWRDKLAELHLKQRKAGIKNC